MGLEDDISPEDQCGQRLLRSGAEGLTMLRAIDPSEANTFSVVVVQDFGGVAVSAIRRALSSRVDANPRVRLAALIIWAFRDLEQAKHFNGLRPRRSHDAGGTSRALAECSKHHTMQAVEDWN